MKALFVSHPLPRRDVLPGLSCLPPEGATQCFLMYKAKISFRNIYSALKTVHSH